MIRFYKLHWEYIWHAHPQTFLETCFGFFCCLQEILRISCNDQRLSWFFFQTIKIFLVLYIWEALLYFDHCENSAKMLFLLLILFLLWNALFFMLICIVDIHIRTRITWWTVVFIWALRVGFHIIIMKIFILCGVSIINNFINKLLSVIFRVFHYWK